MRARGRAKGRTAAKPKKVTAVPQGYHTVNAYLVVRGAADAIAYYTKAFGAKERLRMPAPDGTIAHAELAIGDSCLMIGDEMPQRGALAPSSVGGSPVTLSLYVPDVDRVFKQAIAAGGKVTMPVADMFWGDRYGQLVDPFGHKWAIATHIEDVSGKEMARRGAEAFAEQAQQGQSGQPPAA
jgi:uncharacterized glyoxalase superfamily protein PhnB